MSQTPIHKVLSTIRRHDVKSLLMGEQACIFYGAAEFSRDTDLVILADTANLERLTAAVEELEAEVISVPPFAKEYLDRGHSIHFACRRADVKRMRLDVMSKMRGVDAFPSLWERRMTAELPWMGEVEIMALPDLVVAKKTQRDKDWPMVRRLVEANYFGFRDEATPERIRFWLRELRTPELLVEAAGMHGVEAGALVERRPLLESAIAGSVLELEVRLAAEEADERHADREYWTPLRAELERLRHEARTRSAARVDPGGGFDS
ncbi:MAG: hypothetical protein Q7S20_04780 [Gemmatimonadaceae bacterium]|nr:hypothetical protein [Gemmatimonadaceae bacterium]